MDKDKVNILHEICLQTKWLCVFVLLHLMCFCPLFVLLFFSVLLLGKNIVDVFNYNWRTLFDKVFDVIYDQDRNEESLEVVKEINTGQYVNTADITNFVLVIPIEETVITTFPDEFQKITTPPSKGETVGYIVYCHNFRLDVFFYRFQ